MVNGLLFTILTPLVCVVGILLWVALGSLRSSAVVSLDVYRESTVFKLSVWLAAIFTTAGFALLGVATSRWWLVAIAILFGIASALRIKSLDLKKDRRKSPAET